MNYTSISQTAITDIEHETNKKSNSSSDYVFTEATVKQEKERDVKNIIYSSFNIDIKSQGQNKETIIQQRTMHENLTVDCGTVPAYKNDVQGKIC